MNKVVYLGVHPSEWTGIDGAACTSVCYGRFNVKRSAKAINDVTDRPIVFIPDIYAETGTALVLR